MAISSDIRIQILKIRIFQTDQGQLETERVIPTEGNLQPLSPAHSDTLVIDNEDDAHSYSDSEQEEDLDLQYMQTDYENNQIVDDICTMYICKRRLDTDMCHDPIHDQGLEPGSSQFKLVRRHDLTLHVMIRYFCIVASFTTN